jgi:hypothetical protein
MRKSKRFVIFLTPGQAAELEGICAKRPGVNPESMIEAWVADIVDAILRGDLR